MYQNYNTHLVHKLNLKANQATYDINHFEEVLKLNEQLKFKWSILSHNFSDRKDYS